MHIFMHLKIHKYVKIVKYLIKLQNILDLIILKFKVLPKHNFLSIVANVFNISSDSGLQMERLSNYLSRPNVIATWLP
ncbi:hypothetical protein QTP88_007311 [Uroleucon formosanum]